jgi:hypothetical protein
MTSDDDKFTSRGSGLVLHRTLIPIRWSKAEREEHQKRWSWGAFAEWDCYASAQPMRGRRYEFKE